VEARDERVRRHILWGISLASVPATKNLLALPKRFLDLPKASLSLGRREACAGTVGGFRRAPATSRGARSKILEFTQREADSTEATKNGSHHFAFNERRRSDWTPDTYAQDQNRRLIATR
jgi:hypothetical protein